MRRDAALTAGNIRNIFHRVNRSKPKSYLSGPEQKYQFPRRAAVQSIRTWHVDIAILNIDMPDLKGLELLKTVRRKSPRTDVIILIDTDSTKRAVGAMKAGARDVLIKPVDEDELFAAIHESLERRYPPREEIVNRMDAYLKDHFSDYTLRRGDLCGHFNLSPA